MEKTIETTGEGAAVGSRRSSLFAGITYGLAVWALAYGVGLPSLGLHPAATDDTKDRNQVLIASHAVWGAVLGGLTENSRARGTLAIERLERHRP